MPHKHFSASRTASCVTCVTCVTSGILPMPEQVAAIRDYTVPKDKGGVQRFLGMLNYCHCFLPKIAGKLAPLHSARRLHGPLSASRRSKQPSQHLPPQLFCTTLARGRQQASQSTHRTPTWVVYWNNFTGRFGNRWPFSPESSLPPRQNTLPLTGSP